MDLTRVATFKDKGRAAVLLEVAGCRVQISHLELVTYATVVDMEDELCRRASLAGKSLPRFFIHKNRDGSLAVATGTEPEVWPEDEREARVVKDG